MEEWRTFTAFETEWLATTPTVSFPSDPVEMSGLLYVTDIRGGKTDMKPHQIPKFNRNVNIVFYLVKLSQSVLLVAISL